MAREVNSLCQVGIYVVAVCFQHECTIYIGHSTAGIIVDFQKWLLQLLYFLKINIKVIFLFSVFFMVNTLVFLNFCSLIQAHTKTPTTDH